jgi:hypothetical protein
MIETKVAKDKLTIMKFISGHFELTARKNDDILYLLFSKEYSQDGIYFGVGGDQGHICDLNENDIFDMLNFIVDKKINDGTT